MKASGDCAAKAASKRSTTRLRDAAAGELLELVAQGCDACRRRFGPAGEACEVVARVRLERHHRRRQAAVRGLRDEQREHRLVAAVHAVEVADRERAGRGEVAVPKAVEDAHR